MNIDALFERHGTDKSCYAALYHALFKHLRRYRLRLLEVGIGTLVPDAPSSMVGWCTPGYRPGGSLRAWRDYFPHAEIHGIDIQPDTQFDEPGITTHLCNSLDDEATARLARRLGAGTFDVVIDDGSHFDRDQLTTLRNLYALVKPGGFYIIEDVVPASTLLTALFIEVRSIVADDFLFVNDERNFVVISRRETPRREDDAPNCELGG
jgi:hypothetical protein